MGFGRQEPPGRVRGVPVTLARGRRRAFKSVSGERSQHSAIWRSMAFHAITGKIFSEMRVKSDDSAPDDGAASFGAKKIAGCRDGRDFPYQNGMILLLRSGHDFPRPIAQQRKRQPIGSSWGYFPSLQRQYSARRDLAGMAFPTITGKLFPEMRGEAVIPCESTCFSLRLNGMEKQYHLNKLQCFPRAASPLPLVPLRAQRA